MMYAASASFLFLLIHQHIVLGSALEVPRDHDANPTQGGLRPIPSLLTTPAPTPTIPARDITVSTGFGTPYIIGCSFCSPDSPWGASCTFTSMPGCVTPTGSVKFEAGTSPVHVGTLTSTALYSSVSSVLEELCPTPDGATATGCSEEPFPIPGIAYINSDALDEGGELVVQVASSNYSDSGIREALIQTIATGLQQAAQGDNCYTKHYEEYMRKRSQSPSWLSSIFTRDHPSLTPMEITFCNTINFGGPQYFYPWGISDYIDAVFSFHASDGDFACDLLEGFLDAFAVLEPEFAVGDIELGEAIDVVCGSEGL
ncbi:hypothetical protein GGR56DRAFT_614492 [Xylariaceae sp. FL0804]|nr:hypothetical protein GGR56DRAFT_614492 [Xylariaceae sp. FL0804]